MSKIKKEIERKFILTGVPDFLELHYSEKLGIIQVYTNDNNRYRMSFTVAGEVFESIKKESLEPGINFETEIDNVTRDEFNDLLLSIEDDRSNGKIIHKTRYVFEGSKQKFEVDHYYLGSLCILEVELSDINEVIEFPTWLENYIITEVTHIEEFSNFNLAKRSWD